jgi:hypothetical protein
MFLLSCLVYSQIWLNLLVNERGYITKLKEKQNKTNKQTLIPTLLEKKIQRGTYLELHKED